MSEVQEFPTSPLPEPTPSSIDIESMYQNERGKIADLYQNVWVWHGTGRYTHTQNGFTDTLEGILDAGALIPNEDFWNGSIKGIKTISATVSRPYATYYSDMHLKGREGDLLFKDSRDERKLNLKRRTLARHLHPKYLPNLVKNMPHLMRTIRVGFTKEWMEKHKFPNDNDYPILVAFKQDAFEPMKTQKYLEASEVRTDKPVRLSGINHLEVPLKYVEETERMIKEKGVNIPVLPRELGERYQTEFAAKDVISGKAFYPKA